MKIICTLLLFIIISAQAWAQQESAQLDGKIFFIVLYEGKQKDSQQNLTFEEGKLIFSDADKYGFSSEEYKCKQKNDTTWTFLCVSKSKKNGTMTWDGKVVNDEVEGTLLWTRLVENPVTYTFKGKQIND